MRFGKPSDRYTGGNEIYRIRTRTKAVTMDIQFCGRKRFCETCQLLKPRGNRPAVKGWECNECRKDKSEKGAESKTITPSQE